tara:strand:- start:136 stop:1539 length:1404 start_codon:yes stop_codon:yes gene_type:complete
MERVLPKTLDYTDVLPLAVESRSRRRTFFPVNGSVFQSQGANIIRIDLSADALLDTQHSYLRFDFTARAGTSCGIDTAGGHAFIRRIRVEQSGTILEDINSYNRLMGGIVLPCQSGNDHHRERSITEHIRGAGQLDDLATGTTLITQYQADANSNASQALIQGQHHNSNAQLDVGEVATFSIPLNTGLLNNDKLLPLMLMSAPLTIEIELAPSIQPVVYAAINGTYDISNVRYIANLIEVGQDVAGQLRMVQEMSGGVLTLAGQTYRHFSGTLSDGTGDQVVNVPARVKSMKSIFFCSSGTGNDRETYDVSYGGNMSLDSYQLKIGSVVYPATPVQCRFGDGDPDKTGVVLRRSEALMELAKAWGNVGSTKGLGQLRGTNYAVAKDQADKAGTSGTVVYSPFGMDLEAFQRVAIESGVNTADRSLPISLVLGFDGANGPEDNTQLEVYVLADALFYINGDGSMSVSV